MIDLGVLLQTEDRPGTFADKEILQDPVVRPAVEHPTALVPEVALYLPHRFLDLVVAAPGAPISKLYALLSRGDISLCALTAFMLRTL
jgi:hypothetical protein